MFEMTVKVFGEADGTFVLYDDFETFVYEKHQSRIVIEKHPGSDLTITQETENASRYRFMSKGQADN